MSDRLKEILPDFGDYSPDVLAQIPPAEPVPAAASPSEAQTAEAPVAETAAESIADRSRRIVMSALGQQLMKYRREAETEGPQPQEEKPPAARFVWDLDGHADAPDPTSTSETPEEDEPVPAEQNEIESLVDEPGSEQDNNASDEAEASEEIGSSDGEPDKAAISPEPRLQEPTVQPKRPRFSIGEDGIITLIYDNGIPGVDARSQEDALPEEPDGEPTGEAEDAPQPETPESDTEAPAQEPAAKKKTASQRPASTARTGRRTRKAAGAEGESLGQAILAPVIRLAAVLLARRQQQNREAARWPDPEDVPDAPELTPKQAARYYSSQSKKLRMRLNVSLLLTAILAWIALGLPMAGMLGRSTPVQAGVSLLLTLVVMLAALDVTTAGLRQVFDLAPGPEALAVLSALMSCVDAALVLFGFGTALPFCAVGAAALTAALWGERLHCQALMRTFRTAASSRSPTCVAVDPGTDKIPRRLFRADKGDAAGLVRRSESQDACRSAYGAAAPVLILAALVLSVIASLGGKGGFFLHTLSALLSVSASFAAFFGFSLPYAITARRLRNSGAAIAGYAGCADIARTREIIITDDDLFPPGTLRFSAINILEGIPQQKVIIAACSLVYTSGSGVVPLFEELAQRRSCHVPEPREYSIHESGGLSGIVNGERVDVGPARFMNLQGIRLPQNMTAKNAVCVAISGELVGVFVIDYTPFTSVQEALVGLLRSRSAPVFAVRDFNITPRMIHDLFKLPSINFNFPAYRARTRIRPDPDRPLDAVITRRGMLPFVEAAEAGRRLYSSVRITTILSLIGSAVGMAILFLLCRTGAFNTASVGNVLSFMILWALPAVLLSYGRR